MTTMNRQAKSAIKSHVLTLRHKLEDDIAIQLKRYGFAGERWLPLERLPHIEWDDQAASDHYRLKAALEQQLRRMGVNTKKAKPQQRAEAVYWFVREIAFTHLNRLVALKCLEVRDLIPEVITTREAYGGRSRAHYDYRNAHPDQARRPDDALPAAIRHVCQRVYAEFKFLFDVGDPAVGRHPPANSILWPSYPVLNRQSKIALDPDSPINNALIHRDYTSLGAVHVQLRDNVASSTTVYEAVASLTVRVSNPGGFVEGVGPDNLLVTEPRPRNPRLADAFKRAGLVERTGRGVETIYRGQLRNGRQPPDYTLSTAASVSVILPSGPADLDFVLLAVQGGRRLGRALEVVELLALWQARREDTTTAQVLAPVLQRSAAHAAAVLAGLAQAGLLQAEQDLYRLAPELLREAGLEPALASLEDAILAHVRAHGRITRREVMALCQINERQATYLLRKLTDRGELKQQGSGRGTIYTEPETGKTDK